MKPITPIEKQHGRYLPWAAGSAAFIGLAGTLWALSEVLENDSDGDGWSDAEEIVAGTDPADETDPWDSDGDGIADYLEFADSTDPLDPNDPPRIRKSVLPYNVAAASNEATNISLESLKSGSQQNMYHNTAWFGKRLNYTFFRPTADSKWQAINGNEIEYWSTGYYDLLARNGSSGIAITVENVPAGKYTLKWKHMQRPDGGSPGYTVSVSGAATTSKRFMAPKSNSEGEVHEASLTFEVNERGTLVLSFDAGSSGTSGPLVGSIAFLKALGVIKVDWNADIGGQEFAVTQDNGAAFTGSDWDVSRTRQANPVAFQSGSNLKLIPTFNNPASPPPAAIRAQIALGDSTKTYTLPWPERGKGFSVPAPVPTGTVGYFENAQVNWSLRYDSETWEDAGSSTHEIYFTRGTPLTSLRQETLFSISCKQAAGLSDPTAIVDAIYAEFTDRDVRRVSDGKQMTYWARNPETGNWARRAVNTHEMLEEEPGNGDCKAWSDFFEKLVKLQSIEAKCVIVRSSFHLKKTSNPEVLLIKNWNFEKTTGSTEIIVFRKDEQTGEITQEKKIYSHLFGESNRYPNLGSSHPATTIPSQGDTSGPPEFNHHWIVKVNGFLYDPSYGTEKSSENNVADYENKAFDGYCLVSDAFLIRKNEGERDVYYSEY